MKDKGEDIESYESTKDKGLWILWKIKARTLSPMKDKGEDFESYEIIKQRTLSPMKQANMH